MTKEEIDNILADTGISFKAPVTARSKPIFAGEPVSDTVANNLLKKHNVTVDDLKKAINELNKQLASEIPNDLRFKDRLTKVEVVSPAFTSDAKWNKKDNEVFQFFSLARSSEGGGLMLLIHNLGNEYRTVVISNSSLTNLADITTACSQMSYKDPDTKVVSTLYDHILKVYDKIMDEALSAYKKLNAKEFGDWAVTHGIPSMMLNNYKLMSVQEEKEVENAAGGKTAMYKAHSLYFQESPFQCLANHYDTLAGVPSRIAKMPRLYSNDFDEPALYHIDLDKIIAPGEPHPTWDKYLQRFRPDEAAVIRAFVWSIFKADNTGRQMLYFYDPDGFSGKSVFEKALASGLGEHLVAALQKDSLNNQFSMAKIWNKRLVVIDDNKNPNLLRSEKVHIVLGSGLADIEAKGRNSFMYKMQCKVIASGNVRLKIDPSANHERTRVITVEPHVTDDMLKEFAVCDKNGKPKRNKYGRVQLIGDATFEQRLIEEFKAFLADCKDDYERLCPKDSSIIISEQMEDALESLSDDTYDIIDEILENHFVFGNPNDALSVLDLNSILEGDVKYDIVQALSRKVGEDFNREDLVQHMIKKYKIMKKPVRIGDTVKKCYVGVKHVDNPKSIHYGEPTNIVTVEQANAKNDAAEYGLFGKEELDAV